MPKHDVPSRRNRLLAGAALAAAVIAGAALGPSGAAAQELGPLTRVTRQEPVRRLHGRPARAAGGRALPRTPRSSPSSPPTRPTPTTCSSASSRTAGPTAALAATWPGVSQDGGASWRAVVVPEVSRCAGGEFLRASDPWVDFSPNGVAYFMSLAFEPDLVSPSGEFLGFGRNAMLVNRSTNGGRSWGDPITLIETDDPRFLNDKNSLTADPTNPSFAYAVWDRLQDFTIPPPEDGPAHRRRPPRRPRAGEVAQGEGRRRPGARSSPQQQPTEVFFKGPTLFTRTTNGGRSWQRPKIIFDPGPNAQTINNIVVVQPSGTVFDFFTQVFSNGTARGSAAALVRQGGHVRSGPRYAADHRPSCFGVVTPDAQEPVRDASILFDVAVDPENGNLYLVWQDVRFRGVDEVAFSHVDRRRQHLVGAGPDQPDADQRPRQPAARSRPSCPRSRSARAGVLVVDLLRLPQRPRTGEAELTDYWAVFCDPGRRTAARRRAGATSGG